MSQVEERLAALGITLPQPNPPVANYVPFVRAGNLVHISGQVSLDAGGGVRGIVGEDVDLETAKGAARICGINLLAQMREGGHTISKGAKRLRIQYANQTGNCPPAVTFFCNFPELIDDNFKRFLENRLRENFNLEGTPIRLRFRKKQQS